MSTTTRFQFKGFSTRSFHFNSEAGKEVFRTVYAVSLQAAIEEAEKRADHVVWTTVQDDSGTYLREKVVEEWLTMEKAHQVKAALYEEIPDVFR